MKNIKKCIDLKPKSILILLPLCLHNNNKFIMYNMMINNIKKITIYNQFKLKLLIANINKDNQSEFIYNRNYMKKVFLSNN